MVFQKPVLGHQTFQDQNYFIQDFLFLVLCVNLGTLFNLFVGIMDQILSTHQLYFVGVAFTSLVSEYVLEDADRKLTELHVVVKELLDYLVTPCLQDHYPLYVGFIDHQVPTKSLFSK